MTALNTDLKTTIQDLLGHQVLSSVVKTGKSTVYKIASSKNNNDNWYLKVGHNVDDEYQRLKWLANILPVPKIVGYEKLKNNQSWLLTAGMKGTDLAELCESLTPDEIIKRLALALRQIHSIRIDNMQFIGAIPGSTLTHGDACTPNFIFTKDGSLSGIIDVGDAGISSPEIDLSAAVWSLNYSLGPGHGSNFLKQYGWKNTSSQEVERLTALYETSPPFLG